ncbi:MAG TPA: ABC transporter substrate-binding protein [Puia sp.]|nr:ABC transporter substrate-binding protein [Puia sp.]
MTCHALRRQILLLSSALLLFACGGSGGQHVAADSPAATAEVRYAKGFTIVDHAGYKEVKIASHAAGSRDTLEYLLLPAGAAVPGGHPGARVIRVPVKSMVVTGSPQIAEAAFAGVAGRIVGVGSGQYVFDSLVREGLRTGRVRQVEAEDDLNNELLISLRPDVVITMTNPDAGGSRYRTLLQAGIPVLPDADWLETTPLGKAEWVKLIGALTGREDIVNPKFDSIAAAYQRLASIGRSAPQRPSVILEMPFKGTWYLPAGGSFMAAFLRDAGADYHWAGTKGEGSLALEFEAVAPEALKADYWLDIGAVDSKKEILARDPRFAAFHAFRTGALFNYNRRVNDAGSNDYWESGVVNPQLVLGDLIRILHPGLLPPDTLVYYKQLK